MTPPILFVLKPLLWIYLFNKTFLSTSYTRSIQKLSNHVIWKIETFIEEDARHIVHRTMTPQSVPLKVGILGPHTVLPITISCPVVFSWISSTVWNLLPFKVDFSFGKTRSCRVSNLGCRGAESPGWFDVLLKTLQRWNAWVGTLSCWNCQSPVAYAVTILVILHLSTNKEHWGITH